jgi:hypothetical protein
MNSMRFRGKQNICPWGSLKKLSILKAGVSLFSREYLKEFCYTLKFFLGKGGVYRNKRKRFSPEYYLII